MNEIDKIKSYIDKHKLNYMMKYNLDKFFRQNEDVKIYLQNKLQQEEWFGNINNLMKCISRDIYAKRQCKTCGKELKIESVLKRNSIYCSGGCKSKDENRKNIDHQNRKNNEQIYEVDNKPLSEDIKHFFEINNNKPSIQVKNKIDEFLSKDSKGVGLYNLIKQNKDVDEYLTCLVKINSFMENKKTAFWFVKNELYNGKRCKKCGKHLTFNQLKRKCEYCSDKCSKSDEYVIDKIKQTCLNKYGVDNPMKNEQIKNKFDFTKNNSEKARQTCLSRYGNEFYFKTDDYKLKNKKTNLQKYGHEYACQSESIKNKIIQTNIKKYGASNVFQSDEIKGKIKNRLIEKYGVDHPMKDDKIRLKSQQKKHRTLFRRLKNKFSQYVQPLFTQDDYVNLSLTSKELKWKCMKCGNEFNDYRKTETGGFYLSSPFPRCPNCYPQISGYSNLQKEVVDFIKSTYNGEIIQNSRKIIESYELDIYLPQKKIAIEFDGLYWHSFKDKNYHLNKTELCEKQDIQLIHIFEDEWINNQQIVKDRIKSILGIDRIRIFARKCKVKEISSKQSNEFLEQNHLQGVDNSKYHYGLFYKDELIAVMTFGKPRFNKKYDYELIRFASKLNYQVIGGASKLLDNFRKQYNGSIISYADRRYSNGKLYKALGFKLTNQSNPNYCYVKRDIKLSRYECQKHKLKKLLGNNFDETLSESENMMFNGYNRIYDCGNLIYVLE